VGLPGSSLLESYSSISMCYLGVLLAPSGATNMTGHEGMRLLSNSYTYSYFLISRSKRMSHHFLVVVTTCDDPFTSRQQRIVVGCNPYCSRRHFFTLSFKKLFYLFIFMEHDIRLHSKKEEEDFGIFIGSYYTRNPGRMYKSFVTATYLKS